MKNKDLWIQYTKTKDKEIKKILIEEYIDLVKIVAGRMYNFYGSKIEYDDLIGFGVIGLIDDLKKLIKTINSLHPDIIVFTGDLIDNPKDLQKGEELPIIETLQTLQAPLGKFWIYGNHDHGGYGTEIIRHLMDVSGFILLQNSHIKITHQNQSLILAGIDDLMLGRPNIEKALANVSPDLFTILLAHEPDFADEAVNFPVDVQLSGHSHGGQVRLPIVGHLYTPLYAEKYVLGKYTIKNRLELYVNAGIGTTRMPYRLFCQPEIHEFTLKTKMS